MNRKLLVITGAILLSVSLTSGLMDPNGKGGYTGSPGEPACNNSGCHSSYPLNSGGGSIGASSTMDYWVYEPLTKYTIYIKVAQSGIGLFGFGAEILNSANNNAGTLLITDSARTQIRGRVINNIIRRNVVHKSNGGLSQDSAIFSFDWTAPDVGAGPVTLYFAGNAANGNGNEGGDFIYTGSQTITPAAFNKVNVLVSSDPFSIYPNPATTTISLHYFLPKNEPVEVKLFSQSGSLACLLMKSDRSAGENNELISIPAQLQGGLYLLSIETATARTCRKIMVN
jgi:hypothetical protein